MLCNARFVGNTARGTFLGVIHMKKILAIAALAMLATPAFAADKADAPKTEKKPAAAAASKDEGIKTAVAGIDAAIAKHDAKAVADLFADDSTFVSPMGDGKLVKGKAEIEKAHAAMFAGVGKDMVTKHTVENIRWIGKDHVFVDASVEMTGMHMDMPAGAPAPVMHAVCTMEMKGGKWLLTD
ncbi:MAG TPA: SgcJ/EcaC family oxidoreductase, partial [bacterium]|nr:SgcJ/EcaC family oxidoreductase [bacterium]